MLIALLTCALTLSPAELTADDRERIELVVALCWRVPKIQMEVSCVLVAANVGAAAAADAVPMTKNGYKVKIVQTIAK